MKNIVFLLLIILKFNIFYSQIFKEAYVRKIYQLPLHPSVKTPTDTCGFSPHFIPEFAPSQEVYLYTFYADEQQPYDSLRYIFGNNEYYSIFAQGYVYNGTLGIEGCLFFFGHKNQINGNKQLFIKAYLLNGQAKRYLGQSNQYENVIGPGTLLGFTSIILNNVDTNFPKFTVAKFDQVLQATNDFCISIEMTQLGNDDTAVLLADKVGDANNLDYAFIKMQTTWYVIRPFFIFQDGSTLDVNIAIFPIVNRNYVGLDAKYSFYGIRSNSYPNPAKDQIIIEYTLDNSDEVIIEIINSNGQLIYEYNQGKKEIGKHVFNLDINNLSTGKYYYSIKTSKTRLIKSFEIIK